MKDTVATRPDGRDLAFSEAGDPEGTPVFFFHGAPGSRLNLLPWTSSFADRSLRLISLDRPGYGGSSPRTGRSLADWPADVEHVADSLGIDRFIVSGHSSGGPYAVACAALLSDRVSGSAVVSGVTDMAWPAAWDGFPDIEASLMRLPDEQSVAARCIKLFGEDGSRFFEAPGPALSDPDAALFADDEIAIAMGLIMGEAFRQGVIGYAQDAFTQGHPWSFDPGAIRTPMVVVHGELDSIVPAAHSRHTAELVPGSSLQILPEQGHISILAVLPDLVTGMKDRG